MDWALTNPVGNLISYKVLPGWFNTTEKVINNILIYGGGTLSVSELMRSIYTNRATVVRLHQFPRLAAANTMRYIGRNWWF